jgi:hypothetical protein
VTRDELEHAIRAACDVADDDEVWVFGSQAILGQYEDAPDALRMSAEVDVAPVNKETKTIDIDAHLGELSPFHQAYGFYVHGVSIEAAVLPKGWERRAKKVCNANTGGKTGLCLEAHDLAVSKLVAFRPKDLDFVRVLLTRELVSARKLLLRISQLTDSARAPETHRDTMREWVRGLVKDLARG